MRYIGVDGCKKGWFTVAIINKDVWESDIFKDLVSLWEKHRDASLILIDIPIGLKDGDSQERKCDKIARELLGYKRSSSVFRVPCRSAVYSNLEEASSVNKQKTRKALSRQSLNIISKIREVDGFLLSNKNARLCIREAHPEVCFWALAGCRPMRFNKKEYRGFLERKEILKSIYPNTDNIVEYALGMHKRKDLAKDDILDAVSLAVTAWLGNEKLISIPESTREFDSKPLPMEIVFFKNLKCREDIYL